MSIEQKQGNVKVVCRFRPLNERQKGMGATTVHQLYDDKTVGIKENKESKSQSLKFSFDKVFDCHSTQEQVYQYAAASVIQSVIEGFNGTIFAYGQTSSGKTHTMQGQIQKALTKQSGIVPRMVQQVFNSISSSSEHIQFRIKVSLVQLYLEKLRDLIDPKKNDLKIRSDKKKGIYIQDLSQTYISSPEDVYDLIRVARDSRAIAATNMNQRSSRSHMLFILSISQNNTDDLSAKTGKLYLVDLAGSQKVGKTGAQGKVLDQAKKINVSLTALGKVINALTDGKSTHVPYRDSKLTRVLQQSLGGNSKTSLIVTCSPHPSNTAETVSTLRFGISAKKIKNKPKINKQMTVAQLQSLLQKAQRQIIQRDKYIQQLKNYILVDLKQKNIPIFTNQKVIFNNQDQQTDLLSQLQRQLQMERNIQVVKQQQINNAKIKYQSLQFEKQQLQKQLQQLKNRQKQISKIDTISTQNQQITPQSIINQLQKLQLDSNIIKNIKQHLYGLNNNKGLINNINNQQLHYQQLLQQYQIEKQKRKQAQQNFYRYQKNMQKRLIQLQNNITQLTHAYYDLVVVQQRWKVDNLFFKRSLQEKDLSIHAFKQRIKDLEDQNRQLQQQRWNNQQQIGNRKKIQIVDQQQSFIDDHPDRKSQHPNIVKVVRGGCK